MMNTTKRYRFFIILGVIAIAMMASGCKRGIEGKLQGLGDTDLTEGVEVEGEGEEASPGLTEGVEVVLLGGDVIAADGSRPFPRTIKAIRVKFIDEADQAGMQGAFSFLRDGQEVPGTFSWPDAKTMEFSPEKKSAYKSENVISLNGDELAKYRTMALNDVNGDGFADILAGAQGTSSGKGRAYLFYGKGPLNSMASASADVVIEGDELLDKFGYVTSIAGDLNADGFADIVVSDPFYSASGIQSVGRVYVFYGGASLSAMVQAGIADVKIIGRNASNWIGWTISAADDVDGDGHDDLLFTRRFVSLVDGEVYFFSGKGLGLNPSSVNDADAIYTGEPQFGSSASAADIDGDGLSDIVIGSPRYEDNNLPVGSLPVGRVVIFRGKATMEHVDLNDPGSKADFSIVGQKDDSWFSLRLSTAGDVDGDGFDDLIVGAPEYEVGGSSDVGMAFLFSGAKLAEDIDQVEGDARASYAGALTPDRLGSVVSAAGDFDGDGYADFLFGSRHMGGSEGFVKLILENATRGVPMDGPDYGGGGFGMSMAPLGDVNGDGYSDFAVSSEDYNNGGPCVTVFLGNSDGVVTKYFIILAEPTDFAFGRGLGGQLAH